MKRKLLSVTAVILCLTLMVSFPTYAAGRKPNNVFASSMIQPRTEMYISVWVVVHMGDDVTSTDLDGDPNVGHAFLVFENESTSTVTIGRMSIDPGEAISVGTFGNRTAHRGIWYNIEAHLQPGDCYAMVCAITSDYELSLVNNAINEGSSNTYDDERNSSAIFAAKVWNRINHTCTFGGDNLSPSDLFSKITNWGYRGYTVYSNYTPPSRSRSSIAYQNGTSLVYYPNGAEAH